MKKIFLGLICLLFLACGGNLFAQPTRVSLQDGTGAETGNMANPLTVTCVSGCGGGGPGSVGSSELTSTTVTAGSYNASNITVDADGRLTFAAQGQLTSLSDVSSSTKTAGNVLVANGTNFVSVALSGGCTVSSAGVLTCGKYVANLSPQQFKLPTVDPMLIEGGFNRWAGIFATAASGRTGFSDNTTLYPYRNGGFNGQICYSAASATTGTVEFDVAIMCNTGGDSADIDTDSFGTDNVFTGTVPGTAGHEACITVNSLSEDSCAQGDHIIYRVSRPPTNGTTNTMTGNAEARKILIWEN